MLTYSVGFPGWRVAARLGLPLSYDARVVYDKEANVFVAESNAFQPYLGIATEGETLEELKRKLQDCAQMALEEAIPTLKAPRTTKVNLTL